MPVLEAIVLAGGEDKRLHPLTSSDHPKCLLPVSNSPVLLYSLKTLQRAGVHQAIVVVCGDVAAGKVQKYLQKEPLAQSMSIQVVTAASESGSADAVRRVADKLSGECVVVMSGDVVTDIPLNTVLFNHSIRNARITSVLAKSTVSASEMTKAGKTPKGVDYVAIDESQGRLLSYAYDPQQLRSLLVPHAAVEARASLKLTTDFRDACVYILSKPVVNFIQQSKLSSIKVDVLPALVNEQWTSENDPSVPSQLQETSVEGRGLQVLHDLCPGYRPKSSTSNSTPGLFCGVYLAEAGSICRRVNNIQALLEINRELATADASGNSRSHAERAIHPSVELGNKTVVATGCIIGEQTSIGDKSSVKRSVIGPLCKMGSNVKIINSVVMAGCSIGDGVHIQNSVVGSNVSIGSKAQLKDCQVGHGYKVPDNADHRDEKLALLSNE